MHRNWIGRSVFITGGLALAATALKIYQWYHSRPLWLDEEMVLLNVRDRAFAELLGPLWLNQAAPVGWLALQRAVITTFGTDDRTVRAVPVFFGIATLWVACWMGRRWMTPLSAAVFVTLCGIAPWMVFYSLEVKPYSADAFWALLLVALTVWAAEPAKEQSLSLRRTAIWWSVAAIGQWFSFAAAFVIPACALVLCAAAWRAGKRCALIVSAQAAIWLVCFAAHYGFSIRTASHDPFLRAYWAAGFPATGAGVRDSLAWLLQQMEPIAAHPGGTVHWIPFWMTVACGTAVLVIKRPMMGFVIVLVPISSFLFAILHVVPLADRLALWTIPALYAAIAVAAGDAFEWVRAGRAAHNRAAMALAVAVSVGAMLVSADIVGTGRAHFTVGGNNHGLDDGRAVRVLAQLRQPGDVVLTKRLGLPAVWWYGKIDIADPGAGRRVHDGAQLLEIWHVWLGTEGCRRRTQLRALEESLAGVSRAAVYLGFDSKTPPGFQELVLNDLSRIGTRVFYSPVGTEGVVAIYDLRKKPEMLTADASTVEPDRSSQSGPLDGCVGIRPAERW